MIGQSPMMANTDKKLLTMMNTGKRTIRNILTAQPYRTKEISISMAMIKQIPTHVDQAAVVVEGSQMRPRQGQKGVQYRQEVNQLRTC